MWEWEYPLESLTNLRSIFLVNIKKNYKIHEEGRFEIWEPSYLPKPASFPSSGFHLLFQGPILDDFLQL